MNRINMTDLSKLNLEDATLVLDNFYTYRYICSNYYNAYNYVCEKFGVTTALLPHREYRNVSK